MKLISTGIKGLDEMLGGGFPEGRTILVCGGPGTGKTIFSLQYLMMAVKRGESGVYATLEEPLKFIKQNVAAFGWDLENCEKAGLLKTLELCAVPHDEGFAKPMVRRPRERHTSITGKIDRAVRTIGAKHAVVDPITSIIIHEQRAGMKRLVIDQLFDNLRDSDCTVLLTSEVNPKVDDFYMEEFLADGVIILSKDIVDYKLVKTVRVEKMRGIKYDEEPRRYMITPRGFEVLHAEPVLI